MSIKCSIPIDTEPGWEERHHTVHANALSARPLSRRSGPRLPKVYLLPSPQPYLHRLRIQSPVTDCSPIFRLAFYMINSTRSDSSTKSQQVFRAVSKNTRLTGVRTQWMRKCECTPRAYLSTLISMNTIMVIYGRDDINIFKYFNMEALWDFKMVLCIDNNISMGLSLCWYVNGPNGGGNSCFCHLDKDYSKMVLCFISKKQLFFFFHYYFGVKIVLGCYCLYKLGKCN